MTSSAPLSLYEHAVLITGGARRLGAAMARTLHGAGCRVMIHHRDSAAAAQALVDELNSLRAGSAASVAADLNDLAVLPGIVAATISAFGRLDVLVNNASTFYPTPIGEITAAQFDDLLGSNLRAPLFLSQAAAPALRQHGGLILNMVDIHAFRPLKRHPVYSAAKAGLAMLTQSLARELAPEIRVNGIAPGPVMWPEGEMDADLQARIIERTALKRIGSADDIARAALFFVRDAPYVTGQILPVDGGRTVGGF
ncbi:MAG: pteridine reductase [Proteobacteria bacterium]|nr:pteridine reductase [Pseudomonadota bacterium]